MKYKLFENLSGCNIVLSFFQNKAILCICMDYYLSNVQSQLYSALFFLIRCNFKIICNFPKVQNRMLDLLLFLAFCCLIHCEVGKVEEAFCFLCLRGKNPQKINICHVVHQNWILEIDWTSYHGSHYGKDLAAWAKL